MSANDRRNKALNNSLQLRKGKDFVAVGSKVIIRTLRDELYSPEYTLLTSHDELAILKFSKAAEDKNPRLKLKIQEKERKRIAAVKLEEDLPSIKEIYQKQREQLDIYERGRIWQQYLQTEKKGTEKPKPAPFWDTGSKYTYYE